MLLRISLFFTCIPAALTERVLAVPALSVSFVSSVAIEGTPDALSMPPGGAPIVVNVTLSEPAPAGCSFRFTERAGSAARQGVDYEIRPADQGIALSQQTDGRYVIAAGQQTASLTLRCIGDWIGEPDKVLLGSLTNPVNCTIPAPNWSTVIEDDDRAIFVALRPLSSTRIEVLLFTDNFRILRSFTRDGLYGAAPSVALGDVFDGDGVPEVIVGSDAGDVTRFYVYRWWGAGFGDAVEYFPYGQTDFGGCHVAAGDCGGFGSADDVAVGPRDRSPVTLQMWSVNLGPGGASGVGNVLQLRNEINAALNIGGRAMVPAMGELNGDGRGDLFAADGPTTLFPCAVTGYFGDYGAGYPLTYAQGFNDYPYPGNKDGLSVSAGDWNGDGITEVVTGAGPNSGSHVLMYDPVKKENIVGLFVTGEGQGFAGGARVAMTPRRHYSPSGGFRTLLLADAISVAHPGVLYSSDGTPPVTPPGGLLDSPGTVIAAWTPAQQRPRPGIDLHLYSVATIQEGMFPLRRCSFRISDVPRGTTWQLQVSQDMQSWQDTLYFVRRTGAEGNDYLDYSLFASPVKYYWRLRPE